MYLCMYVYIRVFVYICNSLLIFGMQFIRFMLLRVCFSSSFLIILAAVASLYEHTKTQRNIFMISRQMACGSRSGVNRWNLVRSRDIELTTYFARRLAQTSYDNFQLNVPFNIDIILLNKAKYTWMNMFFFYFIHLYFSSFVFLFQ